MHQCSHASGRRGRRPTSALGAVFATLVLGGFAVAGPVWIEDRFGDAGELPKEAQITTGSGPLLAIKGRTASSAQPGLPDVVDLYLIRVCDPEAFIASVVPEDGGAAEFDTQLFLFRAPDPGIAIGRLANDDVEPRVPFSRITSVSNDGSGAALTVPGRFWLAISVKDRDPANEQGIIFDNLEDPTEISGPDGPGGDTPLQFWIGEPQLPGGEYTIVLTGAGVGGGPNLDCNRNGRVDACDIALGFSLDENEDGIPDECQQPTCVGDLNGDGEVGFQDLLDLLAAFGPCPPGPCAGDWNNSGALDFPDLVTTLAAWGPC